MMSLTKAWHELHIITINVFRSKMKALTGCLSRNKECKQRGKKNHGGHSLTDRCMTFPLCYLQRLYMDVARKAHRSNVDPPHFYFPSHIGIPLPPPLRHLEKVKISK